MNEDIFRGYGVEIELLPLPNKDADDTFSVVKETLTRMGVASRKENKLFQSCHIFHKQGRYAIFHFKEMFLFDGKPSSFTEEDTGRRNKIVELLRDWNLVKVLNPKLIESPVIPMNQIKILNHDEKEDWTLESKYSIGQKRF